MDKKVYLHYGILSAPGDASCRDVFAQQRAEASPSFTVRDWKKNKKHPKHTSGAVSAMYSTSPEQGDLISLLFCLVYVSCPIKSGFHTVDLVALDVV